MAALGFGVGLVFRSIPRALLEEARARDFPVFEVPFEVPFRDIIAFINRSYLSDDFSSLKRTVALQNTLLGADGREPPGGGPRRPPGHDRRRRRPLPAGRRRGGRRRTVPVGAIWEEIARRGGGHDVFVGGRAGGGGLARSSSRARCGSGWPWPGGPARSPRCWSGRWWRWPSASCASSTSPTMCGSWRNGSGGRARSTTSSTSSGPGRCHRSGWSCSASAKGPWRVALLSVGQDPGRGAPPGGNSAAATGTPHLLGLHHGYVALVVEGDGELLETWTANLAAAGLPVRAAIGRAVEVPSRPGRFPMLTPAWPSTSSTGRAPPPAGCSASRTSS